VWLSKSKLQLIMKESAMLKEGAPLFVLRRLIPLVFSWDELAASRGQGLNCKSPDDMLTKDPLDPMKVLVCKGRRALWSHSLLVLRIGWNFGTQIFFPQFCLKFGRLSAIFRLLPELCRFPQKNELRNNIYYSFRYFHFCQNFEITLCAEILNIVANLDKVQC